MGVSVREEFTIEWKEILNLVEDVEFEIQNVDNFGDLFFQQALTLPGAGEIGKRLKPSGHAVITPEAGSSVYGRSQDSKGLAYYD